MQTGLDWEVLEWKMDEEEPDVVSVISVSLNKKNGHAMNAGRFEIFVAMANLLNPDPANGIVTYEPVRDQLIELYDSNVDIPDFFFALLWRQVVEGVSISQG